MKKLPALILAGGLSSRMGRDKALVRLAGQPLITHVIERIRPQVSHLVINSNDRSLGEVFPNIELVHDLTDRRFGPLSGILTGMSYFSSIGEKTFLTVSVDSPFLPLDLVDRLTCEATNDQAIVLAASEHGMHPTIGIWPSALQHDLRGWLETAKRYSVMSFLERHIVKTVHWPNMVRNDQSIDPFFNINNEIELDEAEHFLRQ